MQELADAIWISCQTIVAFNPDDLSVREKLRLASMRSATVEEDVAYSMIGIFKSDIRPDYGEGDIALGHLLEEIVARSGEVALLDWNGIPSSYNNGCLPAALTVYSRPPRPSLPITVVEMDVRVAALRNSLSKEDTIFFNERVTRLPPARFANRRLHIPCIIFPVRRLGVQDFGNALENHYRARVSVIGDVKFQSSDRFSLMEPQKLVFVHPWVRDLRDPPDGFTWRSTANDGDNVSYVETVHSSTSTWAVHAPVPAVTMDDYTRALRLGVRLQEPFHALLLQQQPNGEFKRVAVEHARNPILDHPCQGARRGTSTAVVYSM